MGRKPRIPPTTDHLVQLLMQCEGADASTTFIDGSQNNATITFTNQAQIDTAQARFGSSSIYFDGTGDQVIVPYLDAFETGTGDFTIEYSVRHQTTVTGSKTHMIRWDKQSPVNDVWFIWNSNGNLQLFYSGNGTSFITLTASGYFTGEANAWVDVALSRQGANLYVLKNGVHHTTWDVSTNNFHTGGSWPIRIGSAYDTQSFGHLGWIDNVRFTVGLGRYSTASYTVKEFYRVASTDTYFSSVVLLLPLNGTDAATTTTDLSTTAHTITFNATAQLDTAQSKFGSASLLLDGNSDYLSIADHADWAFGSGEWTIECHVRFNGDPGTAWMNFVNQWTNAGNQKSWWVGYRDNRLQAFTSSTGSNGLFILNVAWNPAGDTWYHIAFCRDNSGTDAIRVFVDGVQIGADDTSINANPTHFNPTSDVWIGAYNGDANDWLNGWIDNVRITKGVCRYTSTFTPPTAPYPTF